MPTGADYSSLILPRPGTPSKGAVRTAAKGAAKPSKAPKGGLPSLRAPIPSQALTIAQKPATRTLPLPRGAQAERNIEKMLPTNVPTLREARQNAEFGKSLEEHPHASLMAVAQAVTAPKMPMPKQEGASPGGILGVVEFPSKVAGAIAQMEHRGYGNLASVLGTSSVGGQIAKKLGDVAGEAINLPTQVLPAAYQAGAASRQAVEGKPQMLHELAKSYAKESALVHLVKGDFPGALKAAGAHPLGTALEAGGAASAVDRTLGAIGRLSGAEAASLAEPGAESLSRSPRELVPGGASEALKPYDKGLVRKMVERKLDQKPPSKAQITKGLRKHYDRTESSLLRISRATREDTRTRRAQAIKQGRRQIAGTNAIVPHAQWLADPSVLDAHGKPIYQQQLSEMVSHLSEPRPGEMPHEAAIREANRDYYQHLREDSKYHASPQQAYQSTLKLAADKRSLEPELEKHGIYTKDQMRTAKAIPAFQFHFRDQNPFVEPIVREGQSPFKLGGPEGKNVSVDEVYKKLEAKGVHEKQLAFVSTRPFENKNAAFRSGHTPGGARVAKGNLTGAAFIRGLHDPTYDAAIRQELTDRALIDRARGDWYKASNYVQDKRSVANIIEQKLGTLQPDQRPAIEAYIRELRAGSRHFEAQGGRSPWQRAQEASDALKGLYPNSELQPVRIVHPYATKTYTSALGKKLAEDSLDKLDPSKFGSEQGHWQSLFPTTAADQHNLEAGPVGLVHSEIAQRMRDYEKDTGKANLLRMPASFWRKANVAFSVRHIPGVAQEVGGRALMNNIGLLSHMRGSKAYEEILRYGHEHPDPAVKLGAQRLQSMGRGTIAAYTEDLSRHVPGEQLARTPLAKPADWWIKGTSHKISGAPLRAVQGAVKGFNGVTNRILAYERRAIEHPPQIAGMGKHYNAEYKRLTGKRLKVIGSFNGVEKAFLHGQLDPKAMDHAANMFRQYWGDWGRASPAMKKAMSVSPFAQWYLNSLRFIYRTMPLDHPVKTGLLAAIEGATAEKRAAEGQGYKGGLPLGLSLKPTDLEPSQQGSLPFGAGWRIGQEYYTPQGAVSGGLESALDSVLPYASGTWSVLHGINPLTDRPLEEKNAQGKKQPITDANQLAMLGALSAAESFLPPMRYTKTLSEPVAPEKQDALGKALGVPGPIWKAFRPLRTEKTRFEGPTKRAKAVKLGPSLGSGLGSGSLGSSLK